MTNATDDMEDREIGSANELFRLQKQGRTRMTNKPEHTALKIVECLPDEYLIAGTHYNIVSDDMSDLQVGLALGMSKDFAEKVTRACNSHYELVEALSALVKDCCRTEMENLYSVKHAAKLLGEVKYGEQ